MHPVIQAAIRQGGGGADTVVVSATTTTPPVVVWAPGAPPAGVANRLSGRPLDPTHTPPVDGAGRCRAKARSTVPAATGCLRPFVARVRRLFRMPEQPGGRTGAAG